MPSLVYEESGQIVGFLGIVRRRIAIGDRRYEAAVTSQFIVDPSEAAGLVAVRLARTFWRNPVLSVADEANDAAKRIWEALGGQRAAAQPLWTRRFDPPGW